jgi:hypothetical protein
MISSQAAQALATNHVAQLSKEIGQELSILPEHTRESEHGWIFAYQAADCIRSGQISDALAGNAPFLVTKESGDIVVFGTAYPMEWYLTRYSAQLHVTGSPSVD